MILLNRWSGWRGFWTIALVVVLLVATVYAATGDLDTNFDTDGLVVTDFASGTDNARKMAVQSDGKIVVCGFDSTAQDFIIARYNTNGSLDTTFDSDGKVTTDFGSNEQAQAMALQTDGKILVAGLSNAGGDFDFAVARYNANGSLDTGFDTDGRVTTSIGVGTSDQAFAIAIQTDGKILVGGLTGSSDFVIVRYNTNGSLDTSFDSDGIVTTDFGGNDQIKAIALQTDGKIVATGFSNGVANDIATARYNTNGSLDTTFDSDGMVTTDIAGNSDQGRAIGIQSDGKIVVVGIVPGNDFMLIRYNTNGSLDTSFDTDGKQTTDFNSSNDQANDMLIQPDGKILAMGLSNASGNFDFAVARYNTNGSLDTSFNTDGLVTIDFGGSSNDQGFGMAIQADGLVVLCGLTDTGGSGFDFGVARMDAGTVPVELMQFSVD